MQANKSLKVAILFSAIGQYSTQIMGFVTIMILARLLTPEEIGIYAVGGTVMLIVAELRSFGVVQYLIREKDIHESKIRSVLGMAIIVSWSLGVLLIITAPYISVFYTEPALKKILWILSITFFVGPFSSVPVALWKRNLQFKEILIMRFFGELVTALGMLVLVFLGYSYYGLATGATLGLIAEMVVIILLKPKGAVWIPKFSLVGDLVKFGFFSSLTNLFTRLSEGIPDLVMGKMVTMTDVGQFSRGFGAVRFLNSILIAGVAPVVLPHLSDVKRSNGSVVEAYLRSVKLLLVFTWPVLAVASAAAYPMINALFGDQWDAAVSVSSILAVWVMLVSVHSFSASAFIVSGAEKLMFISGLIILISRLILVVLAAPNGLDAIAWAMVISGFIELTVHTIALNKCMGLIVNKLIPVIIPNLFIAFVCWLTTLMIDQIIIFKETNPWQSSAIIAVSLPIVWLLLIRLTKHEVWYLILDILNKMITVSLRGK